MSDFLKDAPDEVSKLWKKLVVSISRPGASPSSLSSQGNDILRDLQWACKETQYRFDLGELSVQCIVANMNNGLTKKVIEELPT